MILNRRNLLSAAGLAGVSPALPRPRPSVGTSPWSNDQSRNLIVPPGAGPNDPRIVIGPDVPPELVTFYHANYGGALPQAWIGEYTDATHYHYEVWFKGILPLPHPLHAEGWWDGTTIGEEYVDFFDGTSTERFYGKITPTAITFGNAIVDYSVGTTAGDQRFAGLSLGRGVLDGVVVTVGSVAIGAAETDIPFLELSPSAFLQDDRKYWIAGSVLLACSTQTDNWEIRARIGAPVGGGGSVEIAECAGGNGTFIATWGFPWTPPTTDVYNIYFSMARRSAGAGTITANGGPSLAIFRTGNSITDMSDLTNWRTSP